MTTTTVEKIVEVLRDRLGAQDAPVDRPAIQRAVAQLDASLVKTVVTLLLQEEQKQAEIKEVEKKEEKKKVEEKKKAEGVQDNQCTP